MIHSSTSGGEPETRVIVIVPSNVESAVASAPLVYAAVRSLPMSSTHVLDPESHTTVYVPAGSVTDPFVCVNT